MSNYVHSFHDRKCLHNTFILQIGSAEHHIQYSSIYIARSPRLQRWFNLLHSKIYVFLIYNITKQLRHLHTVYTLKTYQSAKPCRKFTNHNPLRIISYCVICMLYYVVQTINPLTVAPFLNCFYRLSAIYTFASR